MYKIINSTGDIVLEAETRLHLFAQALLFFECTDFSIDFDKMECIFLGEKCTIAEGEKK